MNKRAEAIRKSARDLQQHAADYRGAVAAVMNLGDYSDSYKRTQIARLQADAEARALDYAKASRKAAQKAVEEARARLRTAYSERDKGSDYARRAWLLREYEAILQRGPDWTRGETEPARRVATLYSVLQEAGDDEGMAVLRIAAAPVLDTAMSSDDSSDAHATALALRLRRSMADDEQQQNAPIDEARRELQELQRAADELDAAILATETGITGRRSDWTGMPTAWAVDVLGVPRANVS